MEIRPATTVDADAVRRIVTVAYQPYVERMDREPAPMLDDYDELIGRGVVQVAVDGGRLVGVLVLWARDDHLYIDNIATAAEVRGRGIGAALLDWAETRARTLGLSEIRLYTNVAMVENLDYYPRRGFVETHRGMEAGYERVYFMRPVRSPN